MMMPLVKIGGLPPQLEVLVHQLCQSVPVFVLQSCPENRKSPLSPPKLISIFVQKVFMGVTQHKYFITFLEEATQRL